jgi:hypothetical protein
MTPQRKLTLANILMSAGIAPLLLAGAFVAATLAGDWQSHPRHEALALAMVLSVLYSWVFGMVCALPACVWSLATARRHPGEAGGAVWRKLVCALLLTPPIGLFLYPHG